MSWTKKLVILLGVGALLLLATGNCAEIGLSPAVATSREDATGKGAMKSSSYSKKGIERHYPRNQVSYHQNPLPHIPGYIPVYIQRDRGH